MIKANYEKIKKQKMPTIENEQNLALNVSGVFKHYGLGDYKLVLNGVEIKCPSQKL